MRLNYIQLFEDYNHHNHFSLLFKEKGFTNDMIDFLADNGYFDNIELSGDMLTVYRKILSKIENYNVFKENIINSKNLGVFWSLNNHMDFLPYAHDEFDNTPEKTYLIQLKGIININNDINWEKMIELYNNDNEMMASETEIVLNKVHVIEMLNEDIGEIIKLDLSYNIDYYIN